MHLEIATRVPSTATATNEHPLNDAVRCNAWHRVKTDAVRVNAHPTPRAFTGANLIVTVARPTALWN
jgi:hypothetical protein